MDKSCFSVFFFFFDGDKVKLDIFSLHETVPIRSVCVLGVILLHFTYIYIYDGIVNKNTGTYSVGMLPWLVATLRHSIPSSRVMKSPEKFQTCGENPPLDKYKK